MLKWSLSGAYIAYCKVIQDRLWFLIARHRFRIPGTGFQIFVSGTWTPDLVEFRIPWAVFRIPKPRIQDSTSKDFPDSGIRFLNRLSPKIHIQSLQTDLHLFLLRIVERIWFKIKAISLLVINLVTLITFTLDDLLMLVGENCCWSLLGPKGLTRGRATSNSPRANRHPCPYKCIILFKEGQRFLLRGYKSCVVPSVFAFCAHFTRSALCGQVYFVREHSIHTKLTDSRNMSNYAVNQSETHQWRVGLKPLYPKKKPSERNWSGTRTAPSLIL